MTGTIRFPFRLTAAGQVATAPYGSEQEVNDAIASIVLTDIGERPLAPGFGITDPVSQAINDVDMGSDIQAALSSFGFEDVSITDAAVSPQGSGRASVLVNWDRDEPEVNPLEEEEEDE